MEARVLCIRHAPSPLETFDNLIFHTPKQTNVLSEYRQVISSSTTGEECRMFWR
jgi:hypothetical protein